MTALATRLGRVSRVNLLDANTALLPFIGDEAVQLSKCPTVQLALVVNVLVVFAASHVRVLTNIGEVLKDNRCASRGTGNNLFAEDMIAIPMKSRLLQRQLFQVSFGTLGSFGLQFSSQSEGTTVNLFPSFASQELTVAGYSRAVESQVNTDNRSILRNNRFRYGDDHMQPPFAVFADEVCCCVRIADVLLTKTWDREGNNGTSLNRREAYHALCPIEGIRALVVTDRAYKALRTRNRLKRWNGASLFLRFLNTLEVFGRVLLFPRKGTFEGFGCLTTGLNEDIRVQLGELFSHRMIRGMVQLDPVLFVGVPSVLTHSIEDVRKLSRRLFKHLCLFGGCMKLYLYRSIHTRSRTYTQRYCKYTQVYEV